MTTLSDTRIEEVKQSIKSNIEILLDVYKEEYNSSQYSDAYIADILDSIRELKNVLDKLT